MYIFGCFAVYTLSYLQEACTTRRVPCTLPDVEFKSFVILVTAHLGDKLPTPGQST